MKQKKKKSPIGMFLSYFGRHKGLFAVDMACAITISAIDLCFPLATRYALNDLLPRGMYRPFFWLIAACVLGYLVRSGLQFIVAYFGHTFGIRVEGDVRQDLFTHKRHTRKETDTRRPCQLHALPSRGQPLPAPCPD